MHEVADSKIIKLTRTTVLFYRIDEIKLTELNDAETDPPENLQDNGATLRVLTQPYPLHSPLEDDLVDPAAFLPCPCVKAGDVALQVQERDLPDTNLLGSDYMIYGVYQDWGHQNPGEHLDGGIP